MPVKAGPRVVAVTFVRKTVGARRRRARAVSRDRTPKATTASRSRPSAASPSPVRSMPPARPTRRAASASSRAGRPTGPPKPACARQISRRLARRAYRRPGDRRRRRRRCSTFYNDGHGEAGFDAGIERRCGACWSARSSCTASKPIRKRSRPARAYRISDLELASRLSFFLWSSIPDDELLDAGDQGHAAEAGRARAAGAADAAPIRARRRSSTNFAGQWL